MQITFEALEQALAPIEELGQGEITFPVGSVSLTLQVLTPEQEIDVQRYASEAIQGGSENISDSVAYVERFKIAVLSHAIVAIGDQDLRHVDMVETSEVLPNKQTVKLPRVQALRKVLLKWTGTVRLSVFQKYAELVERTERRAEQAIQFEPADLESEIERVEKRLAVLKEKRTTEEERDFSTPVSKLTKKLAGQEKQEQAEFQEHLDQSASARVGIVPEEESEEVPVVSPPQVRQSIIPQTAPPPGAVTPVVPQPVQPSQPSQPPRRKEVQAADDSFVDSEDSDAMSAAVMAENQRLLAMRRQNSIQQAQQVVDQAIEQGTSVLPARHEIRRQGALRKPPHLDALEAAHAEYHPDDFDASQLVGRASDGSPVVQLQPLEELNQLRERQAETRVPLNQGGDGKKGTNPRFRPRG